jgi:hypothetical protein
MAKIQILKIDGKLPSLNEYINKERMNRFAAASMKRKETNRVTYECMAQKIKPMDKIDEAFFFYTHSSMRGDFDGFEFYQKFIWDGLKDAKVIPNDTQRYTPHIRHHIHRSGKTDDLEVRLIEYEREDNSDSSLSELRR